MRTGISALAHVKKQLLNSMEFKQITNGRIYFVAATMGAQRPYVTATRTAIVSEYSKDGWDNDRVIVAIEVVANDYDTVVRLAELVRETLEGHSVSYEGWEVCECELTRAVDGYSPEVDAFVISLEFTLQVR